MFSFENVSHQNRELVSSFIRQHWYSTQMVLRGGLHPSHQLPWAVAPFRGQDCCAAFIPHHSFLFGDLKFGLSLPK